MKKARWGCPARDDGPQLGLTQYVMPAILLKWLNVVRHEQTFHLHYSVPSIIPLSKVTQIAVLA